MPEGVNTPCLPDQACTSPFQLGWDTIITTGGSTFLRQLFWFPPCPLPGLYWVEDKVNCGDSVPPPSSPTASISSAQSPIIEVVNTQVWWVDPLPSVACTGQSIQVCVKVGGAPYVTGYTWELCGQSVYVPSGPLGSGDTAVVCTTLVLPSTPGSCTVGLSVQYDTSQVFCPGCCSGLLTRPDPTGSGCDGCFGVRHTLQVESPTCVLTAAPETVCVGQPVAFDLGFLACSTACAQGWTYLWSFGDGQGTTSSSPTLTHTYSAAGTYTARVHACCLPASRSGDGHDHGESSPPPCACEASVTVHVVAPPQLTLSGPTQMCWDTTVPRFVVSGVQPGDQVSWSFSCQGGGPTYTLSPMQDTLTVWNWGGAEACLVQVSVRRGPCRPSAQRFIGKGRLLATLEGTSLTTCRAAEYWVANPPPGSTVQWIVPAGVSYTLGGSNPANPLLLVHKWGPFFSQGARLCAVVSAPFGCNDTLCLELASCCGDTTTARVYTHPVSVKDILTQWGADAFTCQTYYINDTLYVNQPIEWVNCQFYFGPYGLVWVEPNVTLTIRSKGAHCNCAANKPYWSRLEPCQQRWPGIYAPNRGQVLLVGDSLFRSDHVWIPVWIIAADTGLSAKNASLWQVDKAVFNRCGVGLYWEALDSGEASLLSNCSVRRTLITQADSVRLIFLAGRCPVVDVRDRRQWPLNRPFISQDPQTKRVRATVGIWVVSGDSLTLTDSLVILRGLHYGVVGEGSHLHSTFTRYERIEGERCVRAETLKAALRITDLSIKPITCPQPFLCPPGTGLCSQGAEINIRAQRGLTVHQSTFDTVGVGIQVQGGSTAFPLVRFPLQRITVTQSTFRIGSVGFSGIQLSPPPSPVPPPPLQLTLEQNTFSGYERGIELIRTHDVGGTITSNTLTAPARARATRAIWISERRLTLKPLPVLLLRSNAIQDYREGVVATLSDGQLFLRQNQIRLTPVTGASGVAVLQPLAGPYLLCQNTLTGAPVAGLDTCNPLNPTAVRTLAFSVGAPLHLFCNTSLGLPWGYHFQDPLPSPLQFYRNTLTHPYLHFYYEGSDTLAIGSPTTAATSQYLFPPNRVRVGGIGNGRVNFYERPPLVPLPSFACPISTKWFPTPRAALPCVGVVGLCERITPPPPPPPFPGVVARLGRPYPRWAAFRSLLTIPDSLWRRDPDWNRFFQQVEAAPDGQLELSYHHWRAGDPSALPVSQLFPTTTPAEAAFQAVLGYLDKAERTTLDPTEVQHLWALATACPDSAGPAIYLAQELLRWLGTDTLFLESRCPQSADETTRQRPPEIDSLLSQEAHKLIDPSRPFLFDRVPYRPIEERRPGSVNPLDTAAPAPVPMYLHLLPNPAEYSVTIWYGELPASEGLLEIYDTQGRRLFYKEIVGREGHQRLNLVSWPRGVYRVVLRSGKALRQETLWIYP